MGKHPNTLELMLQNIKNEKESIYKSFDFKRHRGLCKTKMSENYRSPHLRTMTATELKNELNQKMKHIRLSTHFDSNPLTTMCCEDTTYRAESQKEVRILATNEDVDTSIYT